MTRRAKKLTTYQRGVIALREEREAKGIAARERVVAARESWRDHQAEFAVREARHNVSLVRAADGAALIAYPAGKGSGAVTAFSQADGFIAIEQHAEGLPAGTPVEVQLIGESHLADLVVIGSHCVGLDVLIGRLQAEGMSVKALNVGSTGGHCGAEARRMRHRPIHLLDPQSGDYNWPFLTPELELVAGYRRLQGIVFRKGVPASRAFHWMRRSPLRWPGRTA
jgi:putative molybdopterin biosynthesis protein